MKKILFIFLILLVGCTKIEIEPTPPPVSNIDIFTVKESTVENGGEIRFDLKSDGIYTLTLKDSTANQVISRERFVGKTGTNKLKIYTKSLPAKYLYLVLEDEVKNQVGKTTIIIKQN